MCPGKLNGVGNGTIGPVPYISLEYDPTQSDASALQLVTELRPEWKRPGCRIEFVRFTEGITNTLLKAVNKMDGVSKEDMDSDAVLLRAYGHGTQVLIDRQREAQNHELLMRYGLAPQLLARFKNGMMYKYLRGRATSPEDLRKPPIYRAVARRLAQWHATVPCLPDSATNGVNGAVTETAATNGSRESKDLVAPGKLSPNVWTVMQKWLLALPTATDAQRERQTLLQAELRRCIEDLSQRPGLGKDSLVFAHCDLLSGNVIVEPGKKILERSLATVGGSGHETTVNFIDYEYATPSPAAFDLANHFAEWGGFDCDYHVLPTRAQRLEFIREYVHAYLALAATDESDAEQGQKQAATATKAIDAAEEQEIEQLMAEVDIFRGVPGLYWGIWALIQAEISQIDFDYASYAEIRLGEYWAWRDEASESRAREGREMPLRERRWAQAE